MNKTKIVFWMLFGLVGVTIVAFLAPDRLVTTTSCAQDSDCEKHFKCMGAPSVCTPLLGPPPPAALMLAMTFGRRSAAADLYWMQVVQYVGSSKAQRAEYEGIEEWITALSDLDGSDDLPYFMGGILLSTYPDRVKAADALFALGEKNTGETWQFAMWRAFVAHFAAFDMEKAADQYERAAALGAPKSFGQRAETLRAHKLDCADILKKLRKSQFELKESVGVAANAQQGSELRVYLSCWKKSIDTILQARRVQMLPTVTQLQTLVDDGALLSIPPLPKGKCWSISSGSTAVVQCDVLPNPENP